MNVLNKILHKVASKTERFVNQWRLYGFSVAFWSYLFIFTHKLGKIGLFVTTKKHKSILTYLEKNYNVLIEHFTDQYKENETESMIDPLSPVWVCWWDGEDAMPDLVKICYNSLWRHSGGHPVKLVTKDNYNDFISIPDHIMEKFNKGIISIAHFSDILRVTLLYEHGGIWIDATILVLNDIPLIRAPFFSLKPLSTKIDYISHIYWRELTLSETREKFNHKKNIGRWTAYLLAGSKKSILFDFMSKLFYTYWNQHNDLIDYFLIDYTITLAYDNIPVIREMIDTVPDYNADIHSLENNLNNEFSENEFAKYQSVTFHKLSWKKKFNTYTKDGELTTYGFLYEEYNKK